MKNQSLWLIFYLPESNQLFNLVIVGPNSLDNPYARSPSITIMKMAKELLVFLNRVFKPNKVRPTRTNSMIDVFLIIWANLLRDPLMRV